MIVNVRTPVVQTDNPDIDAEKAVRRAAIPLLTVMLYLAKRSIDAPCTVWEIERATDIPANIVRDVVRSLLRNGHNVEVYDAIAYPTVRDEVRR